MTLLEELHQEAEDRSIGVYYGDVEIDLSIIVRSHDICCIALDDSVREDERVEVMAIVHEIGHEATGSFYNAYTPYDLRGKHERRAWKWAVERAVDKDELYEHLQMYDGNLWEVAEVMGLHVELVRKACEVYFQAA